MVSLVRYATPLLLLAVVASTWAAERPAHPALDGTVVRVVDGDTIVVRIGARMERVRYIGVNAPEVHHPTRGEEPGGGGGPGGERPPPAGRRRGGAGPTREGAPRPPPPAPTPWGGSTRPRAPPPHP